MKETMYFEQGVGLAATQIGVPLNIFVWDVSEKRNEPHYILNPKIMTKEGTIYFEEGCLSIPGFRYKIKRYEKIRVKGIDEKVNEADFFIDSLSSIVFQHEIDHLNGKLFIDRIPPMERRKVKEFLIKEGIAKGESKNIL